MNITDEKILAIEKVHQAFAVIMKHERCRTCSCLHTDMLAAILEAIHEVGGEKADDRLAASGRDFSQWLEDAGKADLHQ